MPPKFYVRKFCSIGKKETMLMTELTNTGLMVSLFAEVVDKQCEHGDMRNTISFPRGL